MKNLKKNGFTLIELIVVVTIIAVLTVIGIINYSGTNRKARDNRRITDLEMIRNALELYRQGNGNTYPYDIDSLRGEYMQQIPVGPKGSDVGDTYVYTQTDSGYGYILKTVLEETGVDYSVTNF